MIIPHFFLYTTDFCLHIGFAHPQHDADLFHRPAFKIELKKAALRRSKTTGQMVDQSGLLPIVGSGDFVWWQRFGRHLALAVPPP